MADIELVIKIPEGLKNDFESEQWTALSCMEMKDALEKATPLPKGHGRIGDLTKLYNKIDKRNRENGKGKYTGILVDNAETIIEADKCDGYVLDTHTVPKSYKISEAKE